MRLLTRLSEKLSRLTTMSKNLQTFCAVLLALSCVVQLTRGGVVLNTAEKADIKDYPFMVALLDDDLDEFLGLGVLVSKNVIFCEEIL